MCTHTQLCTVQLMTEIHPFSITVVVQSRSDADFLLQVFCFYCLKNSCECGSQDSRHHLGLKQKLKYSSFSGSLLTNKHQQKDPVSITAPPPVR